MILFYISQNPFFFFCRLGPAQHTQYNLRPLSNFVQLISALALGQDHTLVLTKLGEVFSWGLNRFSQLGYVVEIPMSSLLGGMRNLSKLSQRE